MATASYVKATSSKSQSDDAHADSDEILSPSQRAKKVKMSRRRGHPDRGGFEVSSAKEASMQIYLMYQEIPIMFLLQPVEVVDYLPSLQPPSYQPMDELHRSCAHEIFLPDQSFLMGRLMLAAWDCGMDGANEAAADVLVVAVQVNIPDIKPYLLYSYSPANGTADIHVTAFFKKHSYRHI